MSGDRFRIRPMRQEDAEAYVRAMGRAFGDDVPDEDIEHELKVLEPERSLVAFDDAQIVGGTDVSSLEMTLPGLRSVPFAGVTGAGVIPSHRRQGVLAALMRRLLSDIHERGEALSALHASEGGIYGRYGFGTATYSARMRIERDRAAFVSTPPDEGRMRMIERAQAFGELSPIHERIRLEQPGAIGRSPAWWEHQLYDPERLREGASALFFALHEGRNGPDGYVVYRVKHEWSESIAAGEVDVQELLAVDPHAYAALWRFVFGIDLVTRITSWNRPLAEPLLHMLAEPRRLRLTIRDGVWLRLVDARAALECRSYETEGRLVLGVRDEICPWNEGRLELDAGRDGAECRASDREPDLVLGAADLAAVYLGGTRFESLARSGRVREETGGALRRADAMFVATPAPWCPDIF